VERFLRHGVEENPQNGEPEPCMASRSIAMGIWMTPRKYAFPHILPNLVVLGQTVRA